MVQSVSKKAMASMTVRLIILMALSTFGLVFSSLSFAAGPDYITILHTNDVHGRLEPFIYKDGKENVGGLARRAAFINSIERSNKNVITLDAGDFAQGTSFFNLFEGKPDVELMYKAGYDAGTLGNHEFDRGLDKLKNIVKASKYPIVAANIRFTEDNELQSLVKPYIIKERYGLKTAIIGLVPKDLRTLVNVPAGIEVLDPIETTRQIMKEVNPQVGLIIVLSHEGLDDDIKLAKSVPGIDVIVGGHSHTLLKQPMLLNERGNKTLIVQDGEFGQYIGRLDLKVNAKVVQGYSYQLIPVNSDAPHNSMYKETDRIVSNYSNTVQAFGGQKVGELAITIGNEGNNIKTGLTVTGGLVTDAIKYKCPQADIVLQNSGGIRLKREVGPGAVVQADVTELYPFENNIITLELKGSEIKSVLETSARVYPNPNDAFLQSIGIEYTINSAEKPQVLSDDGLKIVSEGNRVSDVKVGGVPLDNEKYYKIAVNDYIFNGGNGFSQFKNAVNVTNTSNAVRDVIAEFIKSGSPVTVEVKDRIIYK